MSPLWQTTSNDDPVRSVKRGMFVEFDATDGIN